MNRWVLGMSAILVLGFSPPASSRVTADAPWPSGRPDSILARIGGRRDLTLPTAVRRWREGHGQTPADSITPAALRGFLDLLVDEAVVTEAAVREAARWSPADSAAHRSLRDRLALAAALDSVLGAVRRDSPDTILTSEALGLRARDLVVAGLAPVFDDSALARVARLFAALPLPLPDSGLAGQLRALERTPSLARADSSAVLARSSAGTVISAEVVAAWARLGLAYRPRIDTPDQVRDLARNLLFERSLRATAAGGRFSRSPALEAELAAHAEEIWRRDYIERRVLADLVPDSNAVAAYWSAHAGEWTLPLRVRGVRLLLDDRTAAMRMLVLLADAASAESLVTRAARRGLDYRFETSSGADSGLFRQALAAGPGAVLGPVAQDGGFWVARVGELLPGRERALAEVRDDVAGHWFAEAAERRARALAIRLRTSLGVTWSPGAVERLRATLRDITRADGGPGAR